MLVRKLKFSAPLLVRVAASLGAVGLITFACFRLARVNAPTAGFAYLVAILIIASAWGLAEAATASLVAMLCFNYFFLPPVGTFTVADPQNWVALFAFLATSLVASQLSQRARQRTLDAIASQREMERLYALSRSILLAGPDKDAAREITRQIARVFDLEGAALYSRRDGATYRAGAGDLSGIEETLRNVAVEGNLIRDEAARTTTLAVSLGGESIGSLAIQGGILSDAALQSVCNLAAIGLERVKTQEAFTQAEIARRSDALKSTLLDAIAHEFQTPLTSIRVAASALVDGSLTDSDSRADLLRVIDEEAERLSRLVKEAIRMARIETGKVRLNRSPRAVRELVEEAVSGMAEKTEGRAVTLDLAGDLPELLVDTEMIELALRQIVDNAVKYSPPGSPLLVGARRDGASIVLSVTDRGPGIPEYEQSRIFEKFYRRGDLATAAPGSGMGLPIARDIVHAHGGEIWVESKPGEGSRFSISLPAKQAPVA